MTTKYKYFCMFFSFIFLVQHLITKFKKSSQAFSFHFCSILTLLWLLIYLFVPLFVYSLFPVQRKKKQKTNNISPFKSKGYHFIMELAALLIYFFVKYAHVACCFLISTWFSHYIICTSQSSTCFHSFPKELKISSMKICWCEMCAFLCSFPSVAFSWNFKLNFLTKFLQLQKINNKKKKLAPRKWIRGRKKNYEMAK